MIVLGLDCATGLQTARTFAERGIDVVGIAMSLRHACSRTRVCGRKLEAKHGAHGLATVLLDPASDLDDGSVIVPCTDAAVLALAEHRTELSRSFRMAIPSKEVIDLQLDKARFAEFAAKHDLPIPRTCVLRSRHDATRAAREMAFPCVLKPSIKTGEWETNVRSKALMVASPRALVSLYDGLAQWARALVLQEWIEGRDTDHYTCDAYLAAAGEPLATFVTRKLRQWPPVVGQGCLSVEHRDDAVRDLALRTLQSAGHHGQGYVEMKRETRSGRLLIIEANVGRPTGRSAAAEKAGVELLMTMYADLVGTALPTRRTQTYGGTKWIHVRRDVQACVHALLHGQATVRDIVRSWRGPLTPALFSVRDPVPFIADLASTLKAVLSAPRRGWRRVNAGGADGPATAGRPLDRSGLPSETRTFNVEGVFRVRAEGVGPDELSAVARVVGPPPEATDTGEPDVTVRFVDHLPAEDIKLLDGGATAYGKDGVYFLDPVGHRPLARVSQATDWGRAFIDCRRGVHTVPFLSAAFDLCALSRGWIPLHGSAWTEEDGTGILVTGWAHSGKTGALLAACARGARPVGDDRILLTRDGSTMLGVGRPIVVKDWHVAGPGAPGVGWLRRAFASGTSRLRAAADRWEGSRNGKGRTSSRVVRKFITHLQGLVSVEVDQSTLDRTRARRASVTPNALVLLETHQHPSIVFEPIDAGYVADRVAAQVGVELLPALRAHLSFKYAYPGKGWQAVERAPEVARTLLHEATRALPAYVVRHPYPCSPARLSRVISTAASQSRGYSRSREAQLAAVSTER